MMKQALLFVFLTVCLATTAEARALKRVGWVEEIAISDVGSIVKAKLDTGAKTSSIDANIIDIRRSGEHIPHKQTGDVVVFALQLNDGSIKTFERPINRYVRIKKKGGGFIRRPVITMGFCIAGRLVKEEVNLANREGFLYPVLVGRNMMAHADLLIDADKTFITRPTCEE